MISGTTPLSPMHIIRKHGILLCLAAALVACDGGAPVSQLPADQMVLIDALSASRGLLPALNLADSSFEGDHYAGHGQCTICHDGEVMRIPDEEGSRNVSIGNAWNTSAMANATRDPYWHAVVAAELYRYPDLAEEINQTCTVCHAPMAVDMARKEGLDIQLFDTGSDADGTLVQGIYSMDSDSPLYNHVMDGVSCSFCHQMADVNLGDENSFNGGYTVLAPTPDPVDRPAYGQYADPSSGYMRQQSGFTPVYASHLATSESCATCHNLKTEALDTEGTKVAGVGHFPEQTIFSEWQNSDFAIGRSKEATCQACHMPKLDQNVVIASAGSTLKRPDFSEHSFLAANTVLQDMLHSFSGELGVPEGVDFAPAINRNRQFLQTAASVEVINPAVTGNSVSFDVNIQNQTGHKLPSGYHSRRVYLHVMVTDSNGALVFESGKINADGGIVGVDEDSDSRTWELHYSKITNAKQVQVYQSIMINSDNERTHSLLNSVDYVKDNRLLPSGFVKGASEENISVKGRAKNDNNFNAGQDIVSFTVPVLGSAPFNAFVELRYQPLSFGHIRDLFKLSGKLDVVDMFRTIYEATDLRDEVISTGFSVLE